MSDIDSRFVTEMLRLGILSTREQETLWQVAQRCARTAGVPAAGAGAVWGTTMGTVAIPGVGAVPGVIAGALAGLVSGTASCVIMNEAMKGELRKLAQQ